MVLRFNVTLLLLEKLRLGSQGEQVWIHNPYRIVCIRFIGNHGMFDAIDAQSI